MSAKTGGTYARGYITAQPAPFTRHSGGTRFVLQTIMPARSEADKSIENQNLSWRERLEMAALPVEGGLPNIPFDDLGDLSDEIRPFDFFLRRGPSDVHREQMGQYSEAQWNS